MATCFIYLRRSSKRKDRQLNSEARQEIWVEETLMKMLDLEVLGLDWKIHSIPKHAYVFESASVKEGTKDRREGFQAILDYIKKHGVDYVLVYEPDRISRNRDDTSDFMKLFDPKISSPVWRIRKGVITNRGHFLTENSRDIIAFEALLNRAKEVNEERSMDSKVNHKVCRLGNKFSSRFPFWYNQTKGWGGKVSIDPEKEKLVCMAFNMRKDGCQFTEIAKVFSEKGYPKTITEITNILSYPHYYGEFEWDWKMVPIMWNDGYRPFITKDLFDEVAEYNRTHKRKHTRANPIASKTSERPLDGMVFDTNWIKLQGTKNNEKGLVYYRQPTKKWTYKVYISERKLFNAAEQYVDRFVLPPIFIELIHIILNTRLGDSIREQERTEGVLLWKISTLTETINGLMDSIWLEKDLDLKEMYKGRVLSNNQNKKKLEAELETFRVWKKDIKGMVLKYASYFKDLPNAYRKLSRREKANILRGLGVSFIVGPDEHITVLSPEYDTIFTP